MGEPAGGACGLGQGQGREIRGELGAGGVGGPSSGAVIGKATRWGWEIVRKPEGESGGLLWKRGVRRFEPRAEFGGREVSAGESDSNPGAPGSGPGAAAQVGSWRGLLNPVAAARSKHSLKMERLTGGRVCVCVRVRARSFLAC